MKLFHSSNSLQSWKGLFTSTPEWRAQEATLTAELNGADNAGQLTGIENNAFEKV